jgi:hypothetical protein
MPIGFQSTIREISYRGVKLSRVPAAFGRLELRCGANLPQVAQPSGGLPPVIRPARTARAGTDQPFAPIEHGRFGAVASGHL